MIKSFIFSLSFVALCALSFPGFASAYDVFNKPCDRAGTAQSATCKDSAGDDTDPISGSEGVLLKIVDIVAIVAGIVAVIMLIVGGIYLITSNGDANNVKSARTTILNALIGIAVIVLARVLIVFVVKKI